MRIAVLSALLSVSVVLSAACNNEQRPGPSFGESEGLAGAGVKGSLQIADYVAVCVGAGVRSITTALPTGNVRIEIFGRSA